MCTNFMIPADTERQYVVTGRTMDFGQTMDTVLRMVPRGESFPVLPPANGYHWQNIHGFVAMTAMLDFEKLELAAPYYSDGLNEAGLSAASLWLPGTSYPEPSTSAQNLYMADLCGLILGMAATVDDAATLLESINVIDFPILRNTNYPPLHFIICDANGDSLIVEFLNGAMQMTRCDNGVMTNAPQYEWHLLNLLNYENLTVFNNTKQYAGQAINGSGMLGVPGDATPPSRFARITSMLDTIYTPGNTQQAIGLASQLLQTVTVPYGTIAGIDKNNQPTLSDYTQWSVVRDHANCVYYFATPFNPTLQMVDLTQIDFTGPKRTLPIAQSAWYNDLTNQLTT